MVKVVDDSFMVCEECLHGIVNDDYTGLDAYLSESESVVRMVEIQSSIAAVDGNICLGDTEKDDDFSVIPCDCCHDPLHGARHHMVVLK